MLTFLKTVAVIAGMFLIVPLAVWGGSGCWRYSLRAFKAYLLIMAWFAASGLALGGLFRIAGLA